MQICQILPFSQLHVCVLVQYFWNEYDALVELCSLKGSNLAVSRHIVDHKKRDHKTI